MLYFLEKLEKSPKRWGLRPQTSVGLRRLGALPQTSQVLTPVFCFNYFKNTTYYLMLE